METFIVLYVPNCANLSTHCHQVTGGFFSTRLLRNLVAAVDIFRFLNDYRFHGCPLENSFLLHHSSCLQKEMISPLNILENCFHLT